ncbi:MAG: cellulase family glycosylhydrolase [Bacteroidota bacterium]
MSLFKFILLSLLGIILLAGIGLAIWLYTDSPFPKTDTTGLDHTNSSEIEATTTSAPTDSLNNIVVDGEWFKDRTGRIMILRGVNLGGSTKVPHSMPTNKQEGFFETANTVSFVDKPFPLEEADEHFSRLRAWGFHFLRFLVTWEAIEHEGPGIYDESYIDYVYQVIKKAAEYDINVFIDPHQDVWSRFSGGDGAPKWTFDAAGLDVTRFKNTGAAIVHNTHGDPFPRMVWPTNYSKLAAATMFTLFFGGNDFAPKTMVNDSIPIQDYLQDHYTNAIAHLAKKLKGLPNVIGYDTMNEPHPGFIGMTDLQQPGLITINETPNPLQAMAMGSGIPQMNDVYEIGMGGPKVVSQVLRNSEKESAWLEGRQAIWQQHGVWGLDKNGEPEVLIPQYFSKRNGKAVDFPEDYFRSFVEKFTNAIHEVDPEAIIFAEHALTSKLPNLKDLSGNNFASAPHRYEVLTLINKSFSPIITFNIEKRKVVIGKKNVRQYLKNAFAYDLQETRTALGKAPTIIGEVGIPFDLNNKKAYATDDYSQQLKAMDRLINAMEANLLNYTLWNYTADNTNERGDLWNDEDLSIFSRDQQSHPSDINSGGRALESVVRPYPFKIAGTPTYWHFNHKKKEMAFRFEGDPTLDQPSEIFLPEFQYNEGFEVFHSPGTITWDEQNRLLKFEPSQPGEQTLIIR